ncbi:Fic family protein [Persicitalea sp.]|uniref:Fic family protein n=1 Tax=Persicitalea sp. TaxID=3100273 RepID=UPI003593F514
MKPPYDITAEILHLVSSISGRLGEVKARYLEKPNPPQRQQSRIRTIHSSLKIEGNTLTQEQITALLNGKRILGPPKDITEALNAVRAYEQLSNYKPFSAKSFLTAHRILMEGLITHPGQYRTEAVGIMTGSKVTHVAPPAANVKFLMADLFEYLEKDVEILLIKSCVFHYETEFIHPFIDGNGRMGRLWQAVLLRKMSSVFEYLPFETAILQNQDAYYQALSQSDNTGNSTVFIEYMLKVIDQALTEFLDKSGRVLTQKERLVHFLSQQSREFTRKDYLEVFKELSTATASRDLKAGVEEGFFEKTGEKRNAVYRPSKASTL